ncbi:MAG TPA: hypothetical protein VK968_06445, partial [Roseimicrobium sp.]|nr:hypothetical protein [Roseimicrobium sp.]
MRRIQAKNFEFDALVAISPASISSFQVSHWVQEMGVMRNGQLHKAIYAFHGQLSDAVCHGNVGGIWYCNHKTQASAGFILENRGGFEMKREIRKNVLNQVQVNGSKARRQAVQWSVAIAAGLLAGSAQA